MRRRTRKELEQDAKRFALYHFEPFLKHRSAVDGLADQTIQKFREVLPHFMRLTDGEDITLETVVAYITQLKDRGCSGTTRRVHLTCIASLADYHVTIGVLEANPCDAIRRPKREKTQARIATTEEIDALFSASEDQFLAWKSARDSLILGLMAFAGLRLREVSTLLYENYDEQESSLQVKGKGNKEVILPLCRRAEKLFKAWIVHRGTRPGALFLTAKSEPFGDRAAEETLRALSQSQRAKQLAPSLARKPLNCHALRHWYATYLSQAGVDPDTVRALMRHSSVHTTMRYWHTTMLRMKRAVSVFDPVAERPPGCLWEYAIAVVRTVCAFLFRRKARRPTQVDLSMDGVPESMVPRRVS